MGFVRKCDSSVELRANEGLAFGLVRSTSFGSKRVFISNDMDDDCPMTPTKKQCTGNIFEISDKSVIESLPQDILIRILCGVEHGDLKHLFHVSKTIREATVTAKQWHFEYRTPRKTLGFHNATDMDDTSEFLECKAQNAPKQSRVPKSRLTAKKLADISVALFT